MKSILILLVASWATLSLAFATSRREPFVSRHHMVRGGGGVDASNPAGELVSTLAKLDQNWIIQQQAQGPKSRWTKLLLPTDTTEPMSEESPGSTTPSDDFVYLLEPPSSTIPSCLICFLGGAGLGQFPHIAYSEFLMRLSTKLNAAILAAPYQVGLDHFSIAKQAGERLRRAVLYCEDDPKRQYPSTLPTYCLGHSLGGKLHTIYIGATGQDYEGIGFIAYNNFGFAQTIRMAREFAAEIRNTKSPGGSASEMLNAVFNVAEMAIETLGVEFTPTPGDTDVIISKKYNKGEKTRLFVFDSDTLDSSRTFLEACPNTPTIAALPGSHLTPVFFKLGLDDLDLPDEAKDIAAGAIGGVETASFGNEQELHVLVDEVAAFILGKGPSRQPSWTVGGQPRIAAGKTESQ